jgi:hypothetical protein
VEVKLNKEDLSKQILMYLSRSGFKLIDGKDIDWRFRPSLHVMMDVTSASVEDWQKFITTELQSIKAEIESRGYKPETKLLEQVLIYLADREKGLMPSLPVLATQLRDSTQVQQVGSGTLTVLPDVVDSSVDEELGKILDQSRKILLKGEYVNDPRGSNSPK